MKTSQLTAKCVTWTTHRSAPVLGRSQVDREGRFAYPLVFDMRTLLRPRTAALRLGRLSRRPLSMLTIVGFGALTLAAGLAGEPPRQPATQPPPEHQTTEVRPSASIPGNQATGKKDQIDEEHSVPKHDSQVSEKEGHVGPMEKTMPKSGQVQVRPKQVVSEHKDSAGKRGTSFPTGHPPENDLPPAQPGLNQAASAAKLAVKNALAANQTENLPVVPGKPPVGCGTAAPLAGALRSRIAGPASLGGSAAVSAKNSLAGINGTAMKRKF